MLDALTKAGFNTETLRRGNRKTNNVDVTFLGFRTDACSTTDYLNPRVSRQNAAVAPRMQLFFITTNTLLSITWLKITCQDSKFPLLSFFAPKKSRLNTMHANTQNGRQWKAHQGDFSQTISKIRLNMLPSIWSASGLLPPVIKA